MNIRVKPATQLIKLIVQRIENKGVIQDVPSHTLPLGYWSSCTNIRFNDGYAQKFEGHSEPYGTPSISPYFLLPVQSETVQYWIYCGLTGVYVTQGTSQHNISGVTYSANADDSWNGGVLGNQAILNNGVNAPQYWASVSPSTLLADLANWPVNTTCKVIKPFKNYLVAMDIDKAGARYPQMVKWSHPADPGTIPSTWDETDATKDAGETVLTQGGGYIKDGGTLGDTFIIYREWSTWEMRYIGGRFIFQFRELFNNSGILAPHCFAEFEGKHLVLTANDLIVHDGRSFQSIVDRKMRNTLFNDIDTTNSRRCFLAPNYDRNEIWVCYPESGQSFATKALIWNYREDTFGFRTLPGSRHIAFDVVDSTILGTIDPWTGTIDSYSDIIDKRLYDASKGRMLMADTSNTKLLQVDDTNQYDGVSFTATLQRTGITFDDLTRKKRIKTLYPTFEAISGTAISVRVGYHDAPEASVTWGSAQTFTVGTDYKVDFTSDNLGRMVAIEYSTTGDVAWKHHYTDVDYVTEGKR